MSSQTGLKDPYLRAWLRANLGPILSYLGLGISFVVLVIMYFRASSLNQAGYIRTNTLPLLYVIGWLTLVTTVVRSVGWRMITRAFFIGMFAHMALAYPLNRTMKIPFGENVWTIAMWVPLMEEITRFGLLALLGWLLNRAYTRRTGMADMVVLGASMGLGFGLHEDMLYPRAMASFYSQGLFQGFLEPWGLVFPTAANIGDLTGMAHLSGGIGIGVAVALLLAFRGPQRLFGLIAAIFLVGMEVFYHGIWNAPELPDGLRDFVISTEPWVHLLIIAGAIGFDLFRRTQRPPETVAPSFALYKIAHARAENPIRWAERMMAVSRFRREYNSACFARAHDDAVPDLRNDLRLRHWLAVATRLPRLTTPHGPTPGQHTPEALGAPHGQSYGVDPSPGHAGGHSSGGYGAGGHSAGGYGNSGSGISAPDPGGYGNSGYGAGGYDAGGYGVAPPDASGYGSSGHEVTAPDPSGYGYGRPGSAEHDSTGDGPPGNPPHHVQPEDPPTGYGPSGGPTGG